MEVQVKQEKQEKLWTREFILICITNFLLFSSFYFLLPTLPIFVTDILKGNQQNVGYIIGVLTLTSVLVRPFSGYLLDTVGRKIVVTTALLAYIISVGGYNFVSTLSFLFILRAVHGFAWGFSTTGAGTIATDVIPPSKRGEGMGYYGLTNTLAMAIGPSLGMLILKAANFNFLFNASMTLAIFAFLTAVFMKPIDLDNNAAKGKGISLQSFFEPKVFSLSGVAFFIAVVYGGIVSFITIYGKEIGISNPAVYFLAFAVTLVFSRPFAGKMYDKRGPGQIMAIGFVSIILSFISLFLAKNTLLFVLGAILMGIGFGITQPTAMAMAINRVEPFRRGAANATVLSAFDLGIGTGSIILGIISNIVGLSKMYLICGIIAIIPLALFYLVANKGSANSTEEAVR